MGLLFGKWSEKGVPHKGWTCVDDYDAGDVEQICAMCEKQRIRFVHVMTHEDYLDGPLEVGCVCAGKMSEDLVGARLREKKLKQIARHRRQSSKPRRPSLSVGTMVAADQLIAAALPSGWWLAAPGVGATVIGDFEIVVLRDGKLWAGHIQRRGSRFPTGYCRFETLDQVLQHTLNTVKGLPR